MEKYGHTSNLTVQPQLVNPNLRSQYHGIPRNENRKISFTWNNWFRALIESSCKHHFCLALHLLLEGAVNSTFIVPEIKSLELARFSDEFEDCKLGFNFLDCLIVVKCSLTDDYLVLFLFSISVWFRLTCSLPLSQSFREFRNFSFQVMIVFFLLNNPAR